MAKKHAIKKKTKSAANARSSGGSNSKKASAKPRPSPSKASEPRRGRAGARRQSWLDAKGKTPVIDQYARRLGTFIEAMADGVIEDSELQAQEQRLARLMREVESHLDDKQHEMVTRLLCELTAYDIMQMLKTLHDRRPQSKFRG